MGVVSCEGPVCGSPKAVATAAGTESRKPLKALYMVRGYT